MKKISVVLASCALLFSLGCASRDYVRQQIDPLVERISRLEACCEEAKAAAKKAMETCEETAKKCEKSFELQLKK
ncbi:MAG: hypothetical protein AB1442_09660 [Nitrospirota bacterium]